MSDPERKGRPSVPTLRPARMAERTTEPGVPVPPRVPDGEIEELEGLIEAAETQLEHVAALDPDPIEAGRPPEEPPRHLPTIGHFGPYAIVGRLALGGMAEILLAREDAEGAGSRYLVVKRILPEYEKDRSFVEMFLDEARVMMRLKHPNVCHVYRFGQQEGTHFIAMEWVNGASLGKLIRRARKTGGIPVVVACKIIACVAEALDHAHMAKDDDGRALGIVHRDVTPDNLMISYDGSVKLLDFGIAKADARAHKTQAGVVKGKFAYMAPEQCRAKELDHRVDIFALGVCLFEALTGRPLYRRETEFETMEAIVRGPIPKLADRMKSPPPELEAIIARCLAKKADDRFSSAGELQEALDRFIAKQGEVVTARRLKELMSKLFKEEMRRGPTVDTTPFGSSYHLQPSDAQAMSFTEDAAPPLEDLPLPELDLAPGLSSSESGGGASALVPDDFRPGMVPTKTASPARPNPTAPARTVPVDRAARSGGSSLTWIVIGVVALGAIGAGAYFGKDFLMPPPAVESGPSGPLTGILVVNSEPAGAAVFVDDREVGVTPATVPDLSTGSHRVRVVLEGQEPREGSVEIRANETRSVSERFETAQAADAPQETGRLTLTTQPRAHVFLRGVPLGETPLTNVEVPAGVLPLELETPDGQRHRRGVVVRANDRTSTHIDLTEPP